MTNPERPQNGSCTQMPPQEADKIFFAERKDGQRSRTKLAKKICENCVELRDCRNYALDIMPAYGVFGGLDPDERADIKYGGTAA